MRPIKLPIFFHTDNTSTLKDVGVEYPLTECDIRELTFYHIGAIGEHHDGDDRYTSIFCDGYEFVCTLKINVVEQMIYEKL
jgi:hypothetical protein